MDWSASTVWWLVAGVLVALELATGTFYLLMLALGCIAGAVAAHAGLGEPAQLIAAVIIGVGATAAWHVRRKHAPLAASAESNRDVNLDIGETVRVDAWQSDGSARASYRGAAWSVQYGGEGTPQPGNHVIVAVHGNKLRVARASAAH